MLEHLFQATRQASQTADSGAATISVPALHGRYKFADNREMKPMLFRLACRPVLAALVLLIPVAGCSTAPLAPEDQALLITVADLQTMGANLPDNLSAFERNNKTRMIGGSLEIEYQFDARATGEPYPYIYTTINRETTVSSAVAAYGAVKAGLGLAGIDARDDSERFHYGDWSYFGTLLHEDEARGFVFYMRDDLTVYLLMISGLAMDVEAMWQQLLLPRLKMLDRR